jgi:hypothetical protein
MQAPWQRQSVSAYLWPGPASIQFQSWSPWLCPLTLGLGNTSLYPTGDCFLRAGVACQSAWSGKSVVGAKCAGLLASCPTASCLVAKRHSCSAPWPTLKRAACLAGGGERVVLPESVLGESWSEGGSGREGGVGGRTRRREPLGGRCVVMRKWALRQDIAY